MIETERLMKNETIKKKGKETRERHSLMIPISVELKINTKKLSKENKYILNGYFIQCKWLYNYLLSLDKDSFKSFNTSTRDIYSLDRDGNKVERHLTLPSKIIQAVYVGVKNNIKALSSSKTNGNKIGKLKYKSEYNSIELNQYGNTHYIDYSDERNINSGKLHIVGMKPLLRLRGLDQIPLHGEPCNARLLRKPSGIYLVQTYYVEKRSNLNEQNINSKDRGLDFGFENTITDSDGKTYDVSIEEDDTLKGLQKKLSRQKKGSKGWCRTKWRIRRCYERINNQKKDKAYKIFHELRNYNIYMQDENIKAWQSGRFGKSVQHSCLGTLKRKLIENNAYVIPRYFPSTKLCPFCGNRVDIPLSKRVFKCSCGYTEDRDVKAAKTILFYGMYEKKYPEVKAYFCSKKKTNDSSVSNKTESCTERTGTQVERMQDFVEYAKCYAIKQFSVNPEALTLKGVW